MLKVLNAGLARIEAFSLMACLLTMLFLATFQVLARNFAGVGFVWMDIVVRILVLWVGLLGAALATQEGHHLSIDVLSKFLPKKVAAITKIIVRSFATIVCVYLADAAFRYTLLQKEAGDISFLNVPSWIAELIIPIAFVLVAFHFWTNVLIGIHEFIAPEKEGHS
jgi:TRAP-type C4-dicarboxylate transport system permease small subunit